MAGNLTINDKLSSLRDFREAVKEGHLNMSPVQAVYKAANLHAQALEALGGIAERIETPEEQNSMYSLSTLIRTGKKGTDDFVSHTREYLQSMNVAEAAEKVEVLHHHTLSNIRHAIVTLRVFEKLDAPLSHGESFKYGRDDDWDKVNDEMDLRESTFHPANMRELVEGMADMHAFELDVLQTIERRVEAAELAVRKSRPTQPFGSPTG